MPGKLWTGSSRDIRQQVNERPYCIPSRTISPWAALLHCSWPHNNMVLATTGRGPMGEGSLCSDFFIRIIHKDIQKSCFSMPWCLPRFPLVEMPQGKKSVCKKHLLEVEENCQGNQQGCYRQSMANDRHIIKYERHLQFNKKKRQAWTIVRHLVCFLIKE